MNRTDRVTMQYMAELGSLFHKDHIKEARLPEMIDEFSVRYNWQLVDVIMLAYRVISAVGFSKNGKDDVETIIKAVEAGMKTEDAIKNLRLAKGRTLRHTQSM